MSVIPISVKAPTIIKAGAPKSFDLNGCQIVSVSFSEKEYVDIGGIKFTNRYAGIITIKAKFKVTTANSGESFKFFWKNLITGKRLMPEPHFATGAESTVIIKSSEFQIDANNVCSLRIILQQPSVRFSEFGIENILVYESDKSLEKNGKLPNWLLEDRRTVGSDKRIRDCPAVEDLSQVLQKMWALGQKASDLKHKIPLKSTKFDKDGCYDIHLLAYN